MKCKNKPGCRCDGCKSFNDTLRDTLQKSMQQMGVRLPVKKRVNRPKGEIYKGMPAPATQPKQPKSLPGQLSLLDIIGE